MHNVQPDTGAIQALRGRAKMRRKVDRDGGGPEDWELEKMLRESGRAGSGQWGRCSKISQ